MSSAIVAPPGWGASLISYVVVRIASQIKIQKVQVIFAFRPHRFQDGRDPAAGFPRLLRQLFGKMLLALIREPNIADCVVNFTELLEYE